MLSNKIYRHFFSELSKYFFVVLFTFTAIVWAVQAVNYLDLIVDDGHAVSVYLGYSLLNVSKNSVRGKLSLFSTIEKIEGISSRDGTLVMW